MANISVYILSAVLLMLAGGMTGFTLNRGAMYRWILSQSSRAALTNECQIMANISTGFR